MTDEQIAEMIYQAVHPRRSWKLKQAHTKGEYLKIAKWHCARLAEVTAALNHTVQTLRLVHDNFLILANEGIPPGKPRDFFTEIQMAIIEAEAAVSAAVKIAAAIRAAPSAP
jgi:hypothetical protein